LFLTGAGLKGRILVAGGDGFIGSALTAYLRKAGETVTATTIERDQPDEGLVYFDITTDITENPLLGGPYEAAVICSAITGLDDCARDPVATAAINVDGVSKLAEHLLARGTYVVFLSSNQVFDGSHAFPSITDPVSPVTEYGRQKARAEQAIAGFGGPSLVLRLTKVLGGNTGLFEQWARILREGKEINPFSDMYMAPVPLAAVLSVLRLAMDRGMRGILHLSGDRDVSYAEIAYLLCERIGADSGLVRPVSWREVRPAGDIFPERTALDGARLRVEFGMFPPESRWVIENTFSDTW